jgi:hypothetical protein
MKTQSITFWLTIAKTIFAMGTKYETTNATIASIRFAELKEVQLSYSEFKICYFFELNELYRQNQQIIIQTKQLEAICEQKIADVGHYHEEMCYFPIRDMDVALQRIHRKMEVINSYRTTNNRIKRAPLEILGTLGHALFGILTEEDARRYNKEIELLKTNQSHQNQLMEQNILITDNTRKIMNSTFHDIEQQIINLNYGLTNAIDMTRTQLNLLQWKTQFNSLVASTIILLIQHEKNIEEITKLLAHTLKGEITELIPLNQLKDNLKTLELHLERGEELPIEINKENIFNIFKTSAIHSILTGDRLIAELTIPIVSDTIYKLFKIIPVPMIVEGEFKVIIPDSNMFMTNARRDEYIPLKEDEYQDCRGIERRKIICKQNEPIIFGEDNACELKIMHQATLKQIPDICKTKVIPPGNYFVHLNDINTFFCTIAKPTTLQVICGEEHDNIELEESGTLIIKPGCYIKNDHFMLKSHATAFAMKERIITPMAKFKSIQQPKQLTTSEMLNRTVFIKDYRKDFDELADQMAEYKEKMKQKEEYKGKPQTWEKTTIIIITGCLLGTTVIYLTIWILKKQQKPEEKEETSVKPIPKARLRNQQQDDTRTTSRTFTIHS